MLLVMTVEGHSGIPARCAWRLPMKSWMLLVLTVEGRSGTPARCAWVSHSDGWCWVDSVAELLSPLVVTNLERLPMKSWMLLVLTVEGRSGTPARCAWVSHSDGWCWVDSVAELLSPLVVTNLEDHDDDQLLEVKLEDNGPYFLHVIWNSEEGVTSQVNSTVFLNVKHSE
ncbi:unnamed protein product [Lampetra fluviatilis]